MLQKVGGSSLTLVFGDVSDPAREERQSSENAKNLSV